MCFHSKLSFYAITCYFYEFNDFSLHCCMLSYVNHLGWWHCLCCSCPPYTHTVHSQTDGFASVMWCGQFHSHPIMMHVGITQRFSYRLKNILVQIWRSYSWIKDMLFTHKFVLLTFILELFFFVFVDYEIFLFFFKWAIWFFPNKYFSKSFVSLINIAFPCLVTHESALDVSLQSRQMSNIYILSTYCINAFIYIFIYSKL